MKKTLCILSTLMGCALAQAASLPTDATTLTAATDWVHVGDNGNYHLKNWNGSGVSRIHAGEGVNARRVAAGV